MTVWGVGLLGLVAGWWVNVVAWRVPVGKPVLRTPPMCPACEHPIRLLDGIPVVSWLVLQGRCRDCGESISVRYPIVEATTALLFVLAAGQLGSAWPLLAYLIFIAVTMTLLITDLDWKRIPNAILFPGGTVAVVLLVIGSFLDGMQSLLPRAFVGGAIHFGILLLIAILSRGGMGMGDVKLAALLGVFAGYLGWGILVTSVFLGFLIGGLIGFALLVTKRKGRKDELAYGPSLIVGAWIAILWGHEFAGYIWNF